MAPNRSRSNSNAYLSNSPQGRRQPSRQANPAYQTPQSTSFFQSSRVHNTQNIVVAGKTTPLLTPERAMSPTSRYNQNLKVLRRHDPTIVSIFDQFSHVCLYHHNGSKWEKKGYEGSMFLFEREQEPRYGFYILNRMGMDDYIQCLYPEDDINSSDEYVMYMKNTPPYFPSNRNSPDINRQAKNVQGREVLGLWMFATDAREPLSVVLKRLMDFVKRNQRYPDEFRYGPGRKPPPNPNALIQKSDTEDNIALENTKAHIKSTPRSVNIQQSQSITSNSSQTSGLSEVDQLFAKLALENQSTITTSSSQNLMGLFQNTVNSQPTQPPITSDQPRGVALLNSIFASVDPSSSSSSITTSTSTVFQPPSSSMKSFSSSNPSFPPPPSVPPSARFSYEEPQGQFFASSYTQDPDQNGSEAFEIHSPKPSMGALPQILNTDVINELLGMAPSRSPSTASSSHSVSTNAKNEIREKGYMADHGEDSEDSMLRDTNNFDSPDFRPGRNVRPPIQSFLTTGSASSLKGDVTPRARNARGLEAESSRDLRQIRTSTPPNNTDQRQVQRRNTANGANPAPAFQAASDLWPHQGIDSNSKTFALVDDNTYEENIAPDQEEEELVELDFSEISVLSDPNALETKLPANRGRLQKSYSSATVTGNTASDGLRSNRVVSESHIQSRKPSRTPSRKQDVSSNGIVVNVNVSATPTSSTTSLPSFTTKINGQIKSPTSAQRLSSQITSSDNGDGTTDQNLIKDMIFGKLMQKSLSKPKLNKYDFVREVLTLIHTDKDFVEQLYQAYLQT